MYNGYVQLEIYTTRKVGFELCWELHVSALSELLKFGRTWSFIPSNMPELALTTLLHCERFLYRIFLLTERSKQILTILFQIIDLFGDISFLYVVYNL